MIEDKHLLALQEIKQVAVKDQNYSLALDIRELEKWTRAKLNERLTKEVLQNIKTKKH